MDNLVLIRVAAALDATLRGASLMALRQDDDHAYRLVFEGSDGAPNLRLSVRPGHAWAGRVRARSADRSIRSGPFAVHAARTLRGRTVSAVEKPSTDRVLVLRFSGGAALVAELGARVPNLALLDAGGRILAVARPSRSAAHRLAAGAAYAPAPIPARLLDPRGRSRAELAGRIAPALEEVGDLRLALRAAVFGIDDGAAALLADEAVRSRRAPWDVLHERWAALERGELDPVIAAGADPFDLARSGAFEASAVALLPWPPEYGPRLEGRDPASTAGWYHEARELADSIYRRSAGLLALLEQEVGRTRQARRKALDDGAGFEDPARHRRWGEALLAGLGRAKRVGETILVPDPYEPGAPDLVVPARPGLGAAAVAEEHFRRSRRAQRGREQARLRAARLEERIAVLESLLERHRDARGVDGVEALESEMRRAQLAVGLRKPTRASRERAVAERPRLEGVRIYEAGDGRSILVGRTARDNHRLTFRLAAPDDFWLHALGHRGAHVIVRNPERARRPPAEALAEAAALAAWFSDARSHDACDVTWTRRKYVRPLRGGAPGTVTLKRYEVARVRPSPPPGHGPAG